jgi:hypothetical protein
VQDNQSFTKGRYVVYIIKILLCSNQTRTGATRGNHRQALIYAGFATGKHFSVLLSAENKKTVARSTRICPWFSVLSETAVVLYKCDITIKRAKAASDLMIQLWLLTGDGFKNAIVSEKDQILPDFIISVTANFNEY